MCILCDFGGQNIHQSGGLHYIGSSSSLGNIVSESSDAASNSSTSYSISVEDTFSGNLSSSSDNDWVAITLNAGSRYEFNLTGSSSGDGTLYDPFLRLYNSNGDLLENNDDNDDEGLWDRDSKISYTATNTGTYYLSAGSYNDSYQGSYQLSTEEIISLERDYGDFAPNANLSPLSFWSGIDQTNEYMQGLQWENGCKWGSANPDKTTTALNFYIYDNARTMGQFSAGPLLTEERAAYISAMNAYSSVANLTFTESQTASDSHILWASLDSDDYGADVEGQASPPAITNSNLGAGGWPAGLTTQNHTFYSNNGQINDPRILLPGSYDYVTIIHELGHSLGLAHPHDNTAVFPGVSSDYDAGDNGLNAHPYTVMTYNHTGANEYAPNYFAYSGFLETLGAFDIAATQALYGANTNASTGNNTYFLDSSNLNGWRCIWDNGGIDKISAESSLQSSNIDLRNASLQNEYGGGGYVSQVGSESYGYTVAFNSTGNCIIENATGSNYDDVITGNSSANTLKGRAGNDTLIGRGGNDKLIGGSGRDTAVFGSANNNVDLTKTARQNTKEGRDILSSIENVKGGDGNDIIRGNTADNYLYGENGKDRLFGKNGKDLLFGGDGNDLLNGGDGNDQLDGGDNNDRLFGEAGKDLLNGGDGNDRLNGGDNNDRLFGEAGKDLLFGGTGDDRLNGGDNNDRLFGEAGKDLLFGGIGNDRLNGGDNNDRLFGDAGKDLLFGGAGNDRLNGGDNNDRLFGDAGSDLLIGGAGDDLLNGGSNTSGSIVEEISDAANNSSTRYSISVEDIFFGWLYYRGDRDWVEIRLDAGSEYEFNLTGEGSGDGTLVDPYLRLYNSDGIKLAHNDDIDQGYDLESKISYTATNTGTYYLSAGSYHDNFIGSYQLSYLILNVNDRLFGEDGNDLLIGGNGNDSLNGGKGNDRLFGETGDDVLIGGKGADTLNGGEGSDKYIGGNGADRFCINRGVGRDVITDYTSGEDKIKLLGGLKESNLTINQTGSDVRIKEEGDLLAIVRDTLIADLAFI